MSDLFGNPEDRVSHVVAQLIFFVLLMPAVVPVFSIRFSQPCGLYSLHLLDHCSMLSRMPFNIHHENLPMQYIEIFSEAKIENFIGKNLIFLTFSFKTYIMGTF